MANGDVDAGELEMMKMMVILVGFDATKEKHVPDVDVCDMRVVTKPQPRQYMNHRGGYCCRWGLLFPHSFALVVVCNLQLTSKYIAFVYFLFCFQIGSCDSFVFYSDASG